MNRIKKLSMEILDNYKDQFGTDFTDNKKNLDQFSIIRSKGLKNEIAGYITKFLKHEMLDKKKQEERIAKQEKIDEDSPEENLDMAEPKNETETLAEEILAEESTKKAAEQSSED
ncbi:MAG: hypothetical protein ACE5RT_03520 [Nitrosopumilaceae archaeon]